MKTPEPLDQQPTLEGAPRTFIWAHRCPLETQSCLQEGRAWASCVALG